jgi:alpha-1,6-mannosyltransferase
MLTALARKARPEAVSADAAPAAGFLAWLLPALVGLAGVPGYAVLLWRGNLMNHALTFVIVFGALVALHLLACWVVLRGPGRRLPTRAALPLIVGFAIVYRLILAPATPSLSTDFFRYVWDGFIQGQGYSPYQYPPNAPALAALHDRYYWPQVNRKEQTSAYPPVAELVFRVLFWLRPFSTLIFKLSNLVLEIVTIVLLAALLKRRGQPPTAAIVYAWHPLPIVEFVASGHIDALAVMLLIAALLLEARGRHVAAGIALGLATLTKLYPGLLLPAFTRRDRWRAAIGCVATVVAGFAPAFITGDTNFRQLPTYLMEEGYDSGNRFFPLTLLRALPFLAHLPAVAYMAAAGCLLAGLAAWLVFGPTSAGAVDAPRRALLLAGAIMLLITPAYPWYFVWLIPLVALAPSAGLYYLTATVAIIYLGWSRLGLGGPSLTWFVAAQYVPTAALLAAAVVRRACVSREKGSGQRGA